MRYGVITGRVDRDPCGDLRGALTPVKTKNHAAITDPAKVGELLRAIDGYQGQPATAFALKIAPYVFARPGELRAAVWHELELDGDAPVWRIPATRMKMGEQHIVPLSRQVVALLNEQGWNPDLIELQLAHAERNKVRSAYNRAERLSERRTMMQAWAEYLDALKASQSKISALKTHSSEGLRSQV